MTNTTYDIFPVNIRDLDQSQAFIAVMDYLMYNATYSVGLLSLPTLAGHNALLTDIDKVLYYNTLQDGTIAENILNVLAKQWSIPAYNFADTSALKLEVVQEGLQLLRKIGTPYAIRTILEKFGYTNVEVKENINFNPIYDGTFTYSGLIDYSGTFNNQLFSVIINSASDLLNFNGDGAGQLSNFVFDYGNYISLSPTGEIFWELTDAGGTRTFSLYDSIDKSNQVATGSLVGDGLISFSGDCSGSVVVAYVGDDTDTGNIIEFYNEIVAISLINKYKKERPELYQLIVKEPSNASGRAITMFIF